MKAEARLEIGGRPIGPGHPCFVIAELSANHRGRLEEAIALVDAAASAGADAVKLQTYTPDTITLNCSTQPFLLDSGTIWDGRTLYDLYAEAMTPWEWHADIAERAQSQGLVCFSSPFDETAVTFLEGLNVPAYKIASFELVDLPLIEIVAKTRKPLILSTGMATLAEIDEAVETARDAGCQELALLVCSSAYPSPPETVRLARIPHLASRHNVVSGLSDHTLGTEVPVTAVAVGASIVEKHLCLDRDAGGPDAAFSLEPDEFAQMIAAVRVAERAVGAPQYELAAAEVPSRAFRRSLFVVKDVEQGDVLTPEHVRSIRPADGLHPRYLTKVLGSRARRPLRAGEPLEWSMLAPTQDSP